LLKISSGLELYIIEKTDYSYVKKKKIQKYFSGILIGEKSEKKMLNMLKRQHRSELPGISVRCI
jgi:hypothetical protein